MTAEGLLAPVTGSCGVSGHLTRHEQQVLQQVCVAPVSPTLQCLRWNCDPWQCYSLRHTCNGLCLLLALLLLALLLLALQVEPGVFRGLHQFMQDTTNRTGRIEVLSFAITAADAAGSEDFNTLPPAAAAATGPSSSSTTAADSQHGTVNGAGVSGRADVAGGSSTAGRQQHPSRPQRAVGAAKEAAAGSTGRVLYPKGSIGGLPEEFATRKERFAELDQLQPGWHVELRSRGDTVDAVFYAPDGGLVGTYATARRQALAAHKAAAAAAATGST